jgi:hypothetical protein
MDPLLLSEPWGLHSDNAETFQLTGSTSSSIIAGSGSPRIIAPFGFEIRYGQRRKYLPQISFPFRWGSDICTAFQLPSNHRPKKLNHDFSVDIFLPDGIHEVIQSDMLGRPDADHESIIGRKVDSFIEWQIHCFRELANDESTIFDMEEKSRKIVRRNWHSVRNVWVDVDKTEAIMALIVKLAQDNDLLRIFKLIARRPRRILLRYRENTPLHRIQELDSACIRDLARRPGRTVAEKAGPHQKLLAVRRHASVETMENRLYSWVLCGMQGRAKDYVATNQHHLHAGSNRVRTVERCGRRCNEWASSEHFQNIAFDQLQHPVQPNYSLQMDERYRHVYKTYRELIMEQHVRDDAWEWQRILWAESARQLVGCTLVEFFGEERASTPYYRFESEYGIWTESPVGPGPFKTKAGPCILIDSRDVLINPGAWIDNPPFDFSPYLGTLGCEQVLFWPSSGTLLVIWYIYWTGDSDQIGPMIRRAGEALRILYLDISRFTRQRYKCFGLALVTDPQSAEEKPGVEVETWPDNSMELEVVGLQIPFTIDQTNSEEFKNLINDFRTGIQLVIDMAIGS